MKTVSLLALYLFTFFSLELRADDMRPASLTVQALSETTFNVIWKVPAKGNKRLRLNVIFDDSVQVIKPKQVKFYGNAYIETWSIQRIGGLPGLSTEIAGLQSTVRDALLRFIDHNNQTYTAVVNADDNQYTLPINILASNTIITYIVLGIEHILVGWDHLLFVACLLFISRTRKKLLLTITGFTLAHSITLIMAATGVVSIPIAPVEAVIALSIVFLAVEIAKQNPQSLSFKYPALVSSSFGLLHGFGFASVLSEIGLPSDEKITALLCFNIGVEIGQLLFIAALYACFFLAKVMVKTLEAKSFSLVVSYFSGTIAMTWLITRLSVF